MYGRVLEHLKISLRAERFILILESLIIQLIQLTYFKFMFFIVIIFTVITVIIFTGP